MEQSTGAVCPALIRINGMRLSAGRLVQYLPASIFIISIAMFIGALVAAGVPQRFQATTTLVLTNTHNVAPEGDTLENAAAIMTAPSFAREVVLKSGIKSSAELQLSFLPPILARWLKLPELDKQASENQPEEKLIHAYLGALKIGAHPDSRALTITIVANKPSTAKLTANVTAKVYLERLRASIIKNDPVTNIKRERLIQAQTALQQALERERTFRTSPAGRETARRAQKAANELSLLLTDRAALIVQRDAFAQKPLKYSNLATRIRELETAIRLKQAIIAAAADNDMRQQLLERAVESAHLELSLERERYNDELMQLQTGITANYTINYARLPQAPNRTLPLTIGGLSALVVAAGLFWLMMHLQKANYQYVGRNKNYDEQDQTDEIVAAPDVDSSLLQPDSIAMPSPAEEKCVPFPVVRLNMEGGKAYDTLRDHLAIAPRQDGGIHLLVTGIDGEADTLLLARELARHLAMRGRTVLLDFSQPQPGDEVQTSGLTDFIAGRSSFAEIISRDPGSRLHLVSHGHCQVSHDQMEDAIELAMAALDQTYDWIVHAIPAKSRDGLVNYSFKHADGVVLIAHSQAVEEKAFEAYELLRLKGLENIVVLLAD